jgi:signal transduction histidine kinase
MEVLHDSLDILIIEDNPADLYLLKKMLKSTRLNISNLYTAQRIDEAQQLLNNQKVHLALLDLSLPDSSGIQSYYAIKTAAKKVPIIILTGLADSSVALEAIKEGAQDYLVKGEFNEAFLARAIQYSFERVQNEEEMTRQQLIKQQEITTAVLTAQENERTALGQELHDNINQLLTGVTLFLNVAITNPAKRDELLVKCRDNLSLATEEIRKLSRALITPGLKSLSLVQSMEELIKDVKMARSAMQVDFQYKDIDESILPDDQKVAIYRITQEQLNNILKHSEASAVNIILSTKNEFVFLEINDNGKGFDPGIRRKGVGITNITSRAELYNGHVNIQSAPGKGCSLKVTMNIRRPGNAD